MNYLLLSLSIMVMFFGHIFRLKRWASFVEIYEKANTRRLAKSMSLGYFADFFLPFHLGDILRSVYAGKKMKNKISFSLATVFVDRLSDILIIAVLYMIITAMNGFKEYVFAAVFYAVLSALLIIFILLFLKSDKPFKKVILKISSVFNSDIQLGILTFMWTCICIVKNIFNHNKLKIFLYTVSMWSLYILSYYLLSLFVPFSKTDTANILHILFDFNSGSGLPFLIKNLHFNNSDNFIFYIVSIGFLLTCMGIFVCSLFPLKFISSRKSKEDTDILPYADNRARLDFLKIYFSNARNNDYICNFLSINSNVSIIENCSAGSNATTLLCVKNNNMFYRKYAFAADGDKLYTQVEWIERHNGILPVTEILRTNRNNTGCCYDMPFDPHSIGFFNFIHSAPYEQSFEILKTVINDLEAIYNKSRSGSADSETIRKYTDAKVISNLDKIAKAPQFQSFYNNEYIIINNVTYKNLCMFEKYFRNPEFWQEIFSHDFYSDIHGDLTVENIIINPDKPHKYFLIDPNSGNIHDSPNLDYAKLLQSLHGGYEFLMHTSSVRLSGNTISFVMTRSGVYDHLYEGLKNYMSELFGRERTRSVYFHEIIHWFRLMPYKINNIGDRALLFYAGMIIVINDIFKEFGNENQ